MRQKLLLLLAAVAYLFIVALETGAGWLFPPPAPANAAVVAAIDVASADPEGPAIDARKVVGQEPTRPSPPGFGIRYTALLDGLVFLSLTLVTLGLYLVRFASVVVRVQNLVLGVVGLLDLILAVLGALLAFGALLGMVAQLLAVPFGTIAYLILFGFFDRGTAVAITSVLFGLKIAALVLVALGGQWSNGRLLFMLVCSLLASVIVSFLHALPPGFLVSITDAVAAIVVAILAILFALPMFVSGLLALVKGLRG